MKNSVIFKEDNQHQITLFPASYDDYVSQNHPVSIVNQILDGIDISNIEATYKGGGSSSYHPRMVLKVIIYAYLRNIYSSRKIEQALQVNVHFMWLSAGNTPDHNTINDFRGKRLKNELQSIFSQVVLFLNAEGVLSFTESHLFNHGAPVSELALLLNNSRFVYLNNKLLLNLLVLLQWLYNLSCVVFNAVKLLFLKGFILKNEINYWVQPNC